MRDKTIIVLDGLDYGFLQSQLTEIKELSNKGMWIGDIAKRLRRDEYEVLLALVHLHKDQKLTRPIAFRPKNKEEI